MRVRNEGEFWVSFDDFYFLYFKELLSVRVRNEGEFWMSFDDFAKQFSHLDLVHIGQYLKKYSSYISVVNPE